MKKTLRIVLSLAIAVCCLCSVMAPAASAASLSDATIDTTKTGSIAIDKANKNSSAEAIDQSGFEFTYLKVADVTTVNTVEGGVASSAVLFGINKTNALLTVLGLTDADRVASADNGDNWYFTSTALNAALANALATDPTAAKNALEGYIKGNAGVAMPVTDADGKTKAESLATGLYLLVETKVPDMVTDTTNPFFVALPMQTTDSHGWNYDVTVYPKYEVGGAVTLDKAVSENGTFASAVTASTGDSVIFRVTSALPSITSSATYLTKYTFTDTMDAGLTYGNDAKIEWFSDRACTNAVATWDAASGKFDVNVNGQVVTITMTAVGLAEINTAADSASNVNNPDGEFLYAGYSNYTIRVTYSASVNSNDTVTFGDEGNQNNVALTWARTSGTDNELEAGCSVYSYGFNVSKLFEDDTAENAENAGKYDHVKFVLQNITDGKFIVATLNTDEGVYYVTGTADAETDATAFEPVTAYEGTAKEAFGQIIIKGLEADSYRLTETETATGYMLQKDATNFVITATEDVNGLTASATINGSAVVMAADTDNSGAATASSNASASITITNIPGYAPPQTGDVDMLIYTVVGAMAVVCACVVIFMLARKKKILD